MRLRHAVDDERLALGGAEAQVAADVVVLVKNAQPAFELLPGQSQRRQRHRTAILPGQLQIPADQLLERHGASRAGFGARWPRCIITRVRAAGDGSANCVQHHIPLRQGGFAWPYRWGTRRPILPSKTRTSATYA